VTSASPNFFTENLPKKPPGSLMPTIFAGGHAATPDRFAVVVSRYNESITSRLLSGALDTFRAQGLPDEAIDVAWVPGAFEIPLVAQRMAQSGKYAAIVCLGAVIRGETTHDEHINRAVSQGLMDLSLRTSVPALFGVLTVQSLEQAIQRAGGAQGNKGAECALAALHLANLFRQMNEKN